jgi:hypothetical protein
VTGTEIPAAWFARGLRLIDIADPRRPREVGHFLPDVPEGSQRVQSNVTTDDRGLFYLLDRLRGLTILERCWSAFRCVEPALVLTAPATT